MDRPIPGHISMLRVNQRLDHLYLLLDVLRGFGLNIRNKHVQDSTIFMKPPAPFLRKILQ